MNIRNTLPTLCALGLSALAMGCDGTASDGTGTTSQQGSGGIFSIGSSGCTPGSCVARPGRGGL